MTHEPTEDGLKRSRRQLGRGGASDRASTIVTRTSGAALLGVAGVLAFTSGDHILVGEFLIVGTGLVVTAQLGSRLQGAAKISREGVEVNLGRGYLDMTDQDPASTIEHETKARPSIDAPKPLELPPVSEEGEDGV